MQVMSDGVVHDTYCMSLMNLLFFYHKFNKPFFWNVHKTWWWKVIFHNHEPINQWVMANMYDGCIETHGRAFGLGGLFTICGFR
jgi:hypothetical protein